MNASKMLFIRKRAADLRPGQRVRAKGLAGRFGWWVVDSVGRKESVLVRRGSSLRLSPRCTVLLPVSADPHLS